MLNPGEAVSTRQSPLQDTDIPKGSMEAACDSYEAELRKGSQANTEKDSSDWRDQDCGTEQLN